MHRAEFRTTIVSCVFPPELTYSATLAADLAEELASAGHEVMVLTPFPNKPSGNLEPGVRRSVYQGVEHDVFRQTRCFHTLAPRSTLVSRLLENLTFGVSSALRLLFSRKPDVLFMNTWPIFASGLTALVARLRSIPYIVYVADVYPESLVVQKRVSGKHWAVGILRAFDRWIVGKASDVFVLSHSARETYISDRKLPGEHVHLLRNWMSKPLSFENREAQQAFRSENGIPPDAFLAVYAGNIGVAAGAEVLVDAFAMLRDQQQSYLLIAGSGAQLDECRRRAEESGNPRIRFHHPWKQEETEAVLGSADLLLLPTNGVQSLVSVPSKLITYLHAGKAVLASVLDQSETARIIEQAGAGWIVPPNDPAALAQEIRNISALPRTELRARASGGRLYARLQLSRETNLAKVLACISRVTQTAKPVSYRKPLATLRDAPGAKHD